LDYKRISPKCLAFATPPKLDELIELNREGGDTGSELARRFGSFFEIPHNSSIDKTRRFWDCCAGSGG